ncbi:MAG: NCS2 family permease [Opitutales bacterium]
MINRILGFFDRLFSLKKNNTTFAREVIAGITTFSAMAYILAVNPAILANAGMDKLVLISVTAIAAALGCVLIAFIANSPIAIAPTMGSNAFFAFVICVGMGLQWQEALSLVFYNGIFFLIISVTGIREKLMQAVPPTLHIGLQAGIGLFIAFLGLQTAGLAIASESTLVAFPEINKPEILFALAGIALMSVLFIRNVFGGILLSVLIMTGVGLFITGSNGEAISCLASECFSMPTGISSTFFQLDFAYPFKNFSVALPIIFTLLIVDIFDTLGSAIAMAKVAGFADKNGKIKGVNKIFLADSISTITGSLLGASTTGAYVESATGIESGGRTGLTSLVVGILFLLALFVSPIINMIPPQAVAPSLIIVGLLMLKSFKDINYSDFAEFMPAVLCMLVITLSCKITEGFAFGLIAYVILMIATKRAKQINLATWVLFAIMLVYLI